MWVPMRRNEHEKRYLGHSNEYLGLIDRPKMNQLTSMETSAKFGSKYFGENAQRTVGTQLKGGRTHS